MTSMSHDPAVAVIGGQLTDMGVRAITAGAAAAPSITALVPAGAEEISMQAAMAFGVEASMTLTAHAAAHEEISRMGAALVNITRMYAQVDATAAGHLEANAARSGAIEFGSVGGPWANPLGPSTGARLLRAEAVPGVAGTPARTPAMANLIAGAVSPTPSTGGASMPAVTNAASTLLGAGSAPLSTLSSLGSAGQGGVGGATAGGAAAGGAGPALASSLTGDENDPGREISDAAGERLL
ncbi:PE family protein [Mycobacterium montefiorense]|uniref:PE family protein n=1 Tax=Mycobacterium montefiorense TaxID=154654 RepID=UPI0021F279D3|nr:PE family protein [Mycobacterium montefiorense]MCV7425668.1 PE family protein [Mycobacterium montefiorense]